MSESWGKQTKLCKLNFNSLQFSLHRRPFLPQIQVTHSKEPERMVHTFLSDSGVDSKNQVFLMQRKSGSCLCEQTIRFLTISLSTRELFSCSHKPTKSRKTKAQVLFPPPNRKYAVVPKELFWERSPTVTPSNHNPDGKCVSSNCVTSNTDILFTAQAVLFCYKCAHTRQES